RTASFSLHPATAGASPLSLHDALPISPWWNNWPVWTHPLLNPWHIRSMRCSVCVLTPLPKPISATIFSPSPRPRNRVITWFRGRSEEHTSELQSRENLVCRLLLEKKNL